MVRFLLGIIKLVIALFLIPLVFAVTSSFLKELRTIDPDVATFFFLGVLTYLAIHLLAFRPQTLFQKGQRFLQIIFGFSQIFARIASYILPVYALVLLLIYLVAGLALDVDLYLNLFLILVGFSVSLHFILAAEDIKSGQEDLLKANYIISILFIWISCIIVSAATFHFVKTGFYFDEFIKDAYTSASDSYFKVWCQLF